MTVKNILIVEDEAIIALELKLRLEEMGFRVKSIVPTAHQAVEISKLQCPDLIFMDVILRGDGTGIDAAKIIRRQSRVPIIFLTGNTQLLKEQLLVALQPCQLLVKPANDWQLIEAINFLDCN
ncbi:MAG: response regulator [Calditrichaeota bacterium]|nr:response regulator [Calditrichota bacterium]